MKDRIYLDYAASTPVAPEVIKAAKPYWSEQFGNPGSLHSFGQAAIAALDQSRETIARLLGAEFREIIFTASATEANNLVLRGVVKKWREDHPNLSPEIIVSSIEHESILETARDLEQEGVKVVRLKVDQKGAIDLSELKQSISKQTALVSIMYGNNEIGIIEPIREIARLVKNFRAQENLAYPLLHTDAVQVFSHESVRPRELGVDYATFSGHKMYSFKGAGILYVAKEAKSRLQPVTTGGGQEFGVRSGTENVPAIVGLARAMEIAESRRGKESKQLIFLKGYFFRSLKTLDSKIQVNGPSIEKGLPHIINVYVPKVPAADLLVYLDLHGVAVSAGSACTARSAQPSHVLQALGFPPNRLAQSLRFSFGRETTKTDITKVIRLISKGFYRERKRTR